MNTKIKDGGPAFPVSFAYADKATDIALSSGLTMRDYFAAKALQGLLASHTRATSDEFAGQAYVLADAMLAAREVKS